MIMISEIDVHQQSRSNIPPLRNQVSKYALSLSYPQEAEAPNSIERCVRKGNTVVEFHQVHGFFALKLRNNFQCLRKWCHGTHYSALTWTGSSDYNLNCGKEGSVPSERDSTKKNLANFKLSFLNYKLSSLKLAHNSCCTGSHNLD